MFSTLIESQGSDRYRRKSLSLVWSLLLHAATAIGLLTAPLFFLEPKAVLVSPAPSPPPKFGYPRTHAIQVVATGHQVRSQSHSPTLSNAPHTVSPFPNVDEPESPPVGEDGLPIASSGPGG